MSTPPKLLGLAPVVAADTRVVVLGSFPGIASLRSQQYYGHPRNQFWPLLSAIWGEDLAGMAYPRRLQAMLARGLGLWDVHACHREGSLDSAIQAAEPNDIAGLLQHAPGLAALGHNGGESARAMRHTACLGLPVARLPSTSPAHAAMNFDRKLAAWRSFFHDHGLT